MGDNSTMRGIMKRSVNRNDNVLAFLTLALGIMHVQSIGSVHMNHDIPHMNHEIPPMY